ncbi:MAG: hypothetical protein Q4P18_07370 [Methanobrevibacter sp.]|uniref:hypothetical protein n=1 Tax=Methanobrevibacter sp. TaxID=66852 RepID=UPI0026DF5755|nr:hypothetical protein [Methanobrevibacter sp.]MDO5849338.1 hypothetical protein [Methanobrevibacter sp.]
MKSIFKIIPLILVIAIIGFLLTANVLIIATDTSEGGDVAPGVDMGAIWNLTGGVSWIYPGNSINSNHQTLHNIYLDNPDHPYQAASEIMEYTYHTKPNLVVTVNNDAAGRIFGNNLVDNIRSYDGGQGYDRAPAIEATTGNTNINYMGIFESLLLGDIGIHFV